MTQGPRDIFHGLSCLLAALSGGKSKSLTLLQAKMAASSVPFQQIPRFIEVHDEHTISSMSAEQTREGSPAKAEYRTNLLEWPETSNSASGSLKHQDSEISGFNGWTEESSPPRMPNTLAFHYTAYPVLNPIPRSELGMMYDPGLTHV